MSSLFGGNSGGNSNSIFGGESSGNQAYGGLSGPLSGMVGNGQGASNQIADMLGLNGGASQSQGFNNWKNSTGYQFGLDQGMQSITGGAATQGLLNSGGTLKALDTYGQNYADTKYGDYMSQLQGLTNSGIASGGVLAQAGQQSSKSPGVSSFLGQLIGKKSSGAGGGS